MNEATRKALFALVLVIHQASGTLLSILKGEEQPAAEDVETPGKYRVPTFGGKPPQDQPTEQG